MFVRIQDVAQAKGLDAYSTALKDTVAIAAEALRAQPLAAKAKEVWSLYVTSVFGDDVQMEPIRVAASRGHHALAKHAIAALERRGQGRDVRALFRAHAAGGKKQELAEQALGSLLQESWARSTGRKRYELFDSTFVGETDATALEELRAFFEVSMILGRPLGAEYIAALGSDPFVGQALKGAILQQGQALFMVAPDGIIGVEGADFGVSDVILVHPVKIGEAQRAAAKSALKKAGLRAPFPQLDREFVHVEHDALQARAKAAKSLRSYESRGYLSGEYNPDANAVCSIVRRLAPGAQVEFDMDGSIDDHTGVLGFHCDSPFDTRDPGLLSEVALDLDVLIGGGGASTSTLPPGFPTAELAPSGRAKCLVSDEKIAKGAVRIVVPREVDTGNFRGVTKGYVLPAHIRTWAEQEGHNWPAFVTSLRAASPDVDLSML